MLGSLLRKPGVAVIDITAPQSFVPMSNHAHASTTKAGVDACRRVLAPEWVGGGWPTLEHMLAAFDPTKHGCEAMPDGRVGVEAFAGAMGTCHGGFLNAPRSP